MAQDQLLTPWARFRRWRWWWQALVWFVFPPAPVAVWAASQRDGRAMAWGLVALITGAWLTIGAQSRTSDTSEATDTEAPSSTTLAPPATTESPPTTPATQPPTPTTSIPVARARPTTPGPASPPTATVDGAIIDQLVVAPEGSDDGYDRDLFEHWIDADSDGCDTRCEVLEAERRTDLAGLPGGGWLSTYDGYTTADSSELEVDHVVALAEAWRSGASAWDAARREAFANDVEEPRALVAVTAEANRSKGDRDPAEWQPSNREAWCRYGDAWVATKVRWELTADRAEAGALRNMLAGC